MNARWGRYAVAFCSGLIFANASGAFVSGRLDIAFVSFLAVALGVQVIRGHEAA